MLVRISYLWPLGVAATLIPFGFLWSASRGSTILLEMIVAGITLVSFARVVHALFDPETQMSDRIKFLQARIRGMIFESVRERIGRSILLEHLGPGHPIDTLHYVSSRVWIEDGDYSFIDASDDGWINDIQLSELKELGDRLDRYARENFGFALRESGPDIQPATSGANPPISPRGPLKVKKAFLLKRYREEIPPDSIFYGKNRSILAVPEEFAQSPEVLADIDATISHIFRFTKEEPSSVAIRREMQGTKDQLAQAIRDHALGAIDELRQTYLKIAEEFLKQLVELGGGYSAEQARRERGNYFESWTEIRWIQSDLRELIIIAVDAGNTDVLGQIAFLPFAISARAVKAHDHFLFQQFYQFALFLYGLANERDRNSSVRDWLIERSWRWPKEIAEFYIDHDLNARKTSPEELEQMREFALDSIRVFQDLLKMMADSRDVAGFSAASREFRRLYRRIRETDPHPNVALLRFQIENAQDDEQRAVLTALLARQEKREEVSTALNLAIDEIFLALGGRVLAQRLENSNDPDIEHLLNDILAVLPNTLQKLAVTFAEASDLRISDQWGWNQWDLVADGEAHFIDSYTKLNQIFVLQALRLLAAMPINARGSIRLPPSDALAEAAREGNPQGVLATLSAIESDPGRWLPVLDDNALDCVGPLRQQLQAVWATEQELAAERTREAPLDPAKVDAFRAELVQSFSQDARLRHILKTQGALDTDLTKSPGAPVQSLGFAQIDDKNAFTAQSRISYSGWGRGYGQGIARGEDEETFAKMVAAAKKRVISGDQLIAEIRHVVASGKLHNPIILQTLEFDVRYREIEGNSAFTPQYAPDLDTPWRNFNGFMGILAVGSRHVPVFDVFVGRPESQDKLLLLDVRHFIRWTQFAPEHKPDEQTYADGQLSIRVIDLNADNEKRNEIIAQNPPWLAGQKNAVAYLRGRALINVFEKFHLEILDDSQAVCLTVRRDPRS